MSKTVLREQSPQQRVLEYAPRKFDLGVSDHALQAHEIMKDSRNDFQMTEALRIQTGLKKIDEQATEDAVEFKTLEKLKEIQEAAYQEAYSLGLEEGRKEAFEKKALDIDMHLQNLATITVTMGQLKQELFKQNETHIMKLVLHVAARLAHHEVSVNNDTLIDILKKAIDMAQTEEEIVVRAAPGQLDFLEGLKSETSRDLEFLKKVRFVSAADVSPGGCIIETNYGIIDARFEERVTKLFESITENLYRVKDKIGAA